MNAFARIADALSSRTTHSDEGEYEVREGTFIHYKGPSWPEANTVFRRVWQQRPAHEVVLTTASGHVARRYVPRKLPQRGKGV